MRLFEIKDFVNEKGLRVSFEDRHPNQQGHIEWTNQLIEFCKSLYPELGKK